MSFIAMRRTPSCCQEERCLCLLGTFGLLRSVVFLSSHHMFADSNIGIVQHFAHSGE